MKSILTALFGASLAFAVGAADDSAFKSPKEKNSYAVGLMVGKQLKQMSADIDTELYLKGLKDGMSGGKSPFADDAQVREAVMAAQTEWRSKVQEKNKKEGDTFLSEHKKKEGVVTTPSGLQYQIVTKGTGKLPTSNDTVVCHYRGTLIDGTEFDNSYKRSEPASFPVTGVIKGWTEALLMMPVGSKWKLTIPAELAYGERGRPNIPANSVLQFDIDLISIQEPGTAPAAATPGATVVPGGAAPKIQVTPATPKPK